MMIIQTYARVLVSSSLAVLAGFVWANHATATEPDFAKDGVPFLKKHCLGCHSGDEPKAELSLDAFKDSQSVVVARKTFENVLRMITTGEMPPKKKPHPSVAEAEAFVEHVKAVWDYADLHAKPDPGRVTMRRLNRTEYRNTIRDLLGVDIDPTTAFPSDDIGHGFDNIGDVLTVSPLLMERYMDAAEQIMSQAITPTPPPVVKRQLISKNTEPALNEPDSLIVDGFRPMRTDGERALDVGPIHVPYEWEPGEEYLYRTRVYATSSTGQPLKVTILVHGKDLPDPTPDADLDGLLGNVYHPARILKTFHVKATTPEEAETLEVRVPPIANRERMLLAIDKVPQGQPPSTLWVNWVALDGPLNTFPRSHRQLLAVTPDRSQADQSREVMGRFLRRAYRRPVNPHELERSIHLVEQALAKSGQWETGIQFAMRAALCSPKFLFRVELDDRPASLKARPLDEFHLASRLSYFLWSSMPDDELLNLAKKKLLTANLDAQVRRMLTETKASALVENFAMQWLQLKRLDFITPDGKLFPTFNLKLRRAMIKETELFFESVMRQDRSILELIDADYTFLNESLARHYGIIETTGEPTDTQNIKFEGDAFQRVSLPDRRRGGLLTQASVLTVNSNPTRTSPVKRGRWVLEQILGTPPPSPPSDVPELVEDGAALTATTLRQRMEEHRKNPSCANCHAKMDPIGFALENYDAIGAFRTRDGEFDIDASGEFADGTKFAGPEDLKAIIMQKKDLFVRCLSEKMLTYALGRGLEYHDRPATERIARQLAANDYRFSVLVTEIAKSEPFRMRRGVQAAGKEK